MLSNAAAIDANSSPRFIDASAAGHSRCSKARAIRLCTHTIGRKIHAIYRHITFNTILPANGAGAIATPKCSRRRGACPRTRVNLIRKFAGTRSLCMGFAVASAYCGKRPFTTTRRILDAFLRGGTACPIVLCEANQIKAHRAIGIINARCLRCARTARCRTGRGGFFIRIAAGRT